MKRIFLIAAAACLVAGLAAPASAAARHHRTGVTGFMCSSAGAGTCMSPTPQQPVGATSPVYAFPQSSAWRLNELVLGGVCNNGRVSDGLIKCPWTGNMVSLDHTYAGFPIYGFQLTAHNSLCVQEAGSQGTIMNNCNTQRAVQEFVPEFNHVNNGLVLSVYATQQAGARRVLCNSGQSVPIQYTSPGGCGNQAGDWFFVNG